MPIRIAHASDLPDMGSVLAASFYDEELNDRMFPFRKEFPGDYVAAWRRRVREHWWDYHKVWIVYSQVVGSEVEESVGREVGEGEGQGESESDALLHRAGKVTGTAREREKEVIMGVAEWQCVGRGWEGLWGVLGRWDPRLLIHRFLSLWNNLLYPRILSDRATARSNTTDPDPLTKYNFEARMFPFIAHHFTSPPHRVNHWSLATLGVAPGFQNRGVGRELVAWGLERARSDDLPAVVVGSKGKETFYGRCGFDLLVGYATEGTDPVTGKRNPLGERGIGGGCILWTRVKADGELETHQEQVVAEVQL